MPKSDSQHTITLEFEDADTMAQALEYIGESDAPVMITRGSVASDGKTYQLWDDFSAASNAVNGF